MKLFGRFYDEHKQNNAQIYKDAWLILNAFSYNAGSARLLSLRNCMAFGLFYVGIRFFRCILQEDCK